MRRGKIVVAAVAILLLVGIAYVVHRVDEGISNAYAQEWVGGMVVDYLRQNGDRWPQSWDDLRPVYEQHVEKAGARPWTFEALRSRVAIQWDVDVERLRKAPSVADGPPFPVIRMRNAAALHWNGHEANETVWRYLTEKDARQPPTTVDMTGRGARVEHTAPLKRPDTVAEEDYDGRRQMGRHTVDVDGWWVGG